MSTGIGQGSRTGSGSSLGLVFPILVVLSVLVLVAPTPPVLLDLLLAANITASVLVLLTTISVRKPLEFSVFPSLLLMMTLVRLVLNVASTRLILTRAHTHGTDAAGAVIEAFGRFVAQGQLIVGLILFAIVVVIQFVVVTKGSTRISEVAARFTLDGMPGKQMAIDAELAAGLLTADQARERRAEITDQADFYSAMDGAGKFVRGDAVAGLLITLINLVGGLAIGILQHHMTAARALEVFATLTIGDGLVSQVPGFLIAVAAGLLATRSTRESNLSQDVMRQPFDDPKSLFLAAALVSGLAFTGLPMLPLLALGFGCACLGIRQRTGQRGAVSQHPQDAVNSKPADLPATIKDSTGRSSRDPRPEDKLTIEPIELELGFRLIKLADPDSGGDLMDRVAQLRNKIAQELGIILPKVKIKDSLRLKDYGYQIKLRDVAVATGELRTDALLAINTGDVGGEIEGSSFLEPASNRPAKWIQPAAAEQARTLGYKVVDPVVVLVSHLTDIVKSHADELLTRQQVHQLLDHLRLTSPKVVDELIPDLLKPAQVHQILCNLLRERVPVRDLESILEVLGAYAERTKDLAILTEYCRDALSRVICNQYRDASRVLRAITLDPALEDILVGGFEGSDRGLTVKLTPQVIAGLNQELSRQANKLNRAGYPAVVVCSASARRVLREITRKPLPKLAILSLQEITADTQVRPQGQVPMNAIKIPINRESDKQFPAHTLVASV